MNSQQPTSPKHIDVKRDAGITITWHSGRVSFYPTAHLRKWSPSADARQLREEMQKNPLTVLPAGSGSDQPLTIKDVEPVGHYAIRIIFSDGHDTGIYSWMYLQQIDPNQFDNMKDQTNGDEHVKP